MKRASVVLPALVDRRNDVGRGLVGHALELGERRDAQLVDVGRRVHEAAVDQLIDQLVAQALDIHRAPAGEMQQRLLALRRAHQPARAARDRLVGQPHHRRAAFRAARGHHESPRPGRPLLGQHAHDLRNDVAGAAHDDGVADAHVLAPDLVLVVQRRVGHGDAADEHGLQARHRGQCAGAPDLDARCRALRWASPRRQTCARPPSAGRATRTRAAPAAAKSLTL